jgi:hypothetical protein
MAEESVDLESEAEEIEAKESFNEEGSVEDIFGNCLHNPHPKDQFHTLIHDQALYPMAQVLVTPIV